MDKIRTIRIVIGDLFRSPVARMNFPAYFNYINTAGKLTPRTLMEVEAVILTFIEEQEKINLQNEENFRQIFEILAKLVKADVTVKEKEPKLAPSSAPKIEFKCEVCQKVLSTKLALAGHKRSHK